MKKIGVIGIGLMGGSIALALKNNYPHFKLYGLDKQKEHLEYALNNNLIDAELNNSNCNLMDIIIIATPVRQVISVIKNYYSLFKETNTLITDMGSTKTYICNQVKENFPELNFIGGHPMTGGEASGPQVAKADLFQSKIYVLIESSNKGSNKDPGISKLSKLLKGIGARVITLTAEEH
ncbi:MAG TPA: prephenate dehydrogenase/arogenate dehydrogenase family protein, partial [Halanaerobiales bacterium]|nr:prephenate dehydrogenase/arogenate dehydrogenase family protein [Halanaerobiales bacterium]